MSDLPNGWKLTTIGEISEKPGQYGSGEAAIQYDSSLPRYVRVTDIGSHGGLKSDTLASIAWTSARPYMLEKGDLVFARSGATVGKTYLYDVSDGPCAYAGYVIKFTIDESIASPKYVRYWTQSESYWRWVNSTLRQGAQPNINAVEYSNHQLPLPPLDEQRRIAEILDAIGERTAVASRGIAKQEAISQGIIFQMLVGPTRSSDAPWPRLRVDQVGQVQIGRQLSPSQLHGRYLRPYLRVANVFDGYIDYSDVLKMNFTPSEFSTFSLESGDILLNEGQSLELVGRSAIYDGLPGMCFQNTLIRFRSRMMLPVVARAIFKLWLDTGEFMKVARQTTSIAHLGAERFAAMKVAVPPMEEQLRIAAVLNAANEQVQAARNERQRLVNLKRGLIEDLLVGRVRI